MTTGDKETRPASLGARKSGACKQCGQSALHVAGYARGYNPERNAELDCYHPLAIVCDACDAPPVYWRCKGSRSSFCKPCAKRYRLRVQKVAYSGLLAARSTKFGYLYLLTLTAPGARVHCKRPRCSGEGLPRNAARGPKASRRSKPGPVPEGGSASCLHERCPCTPPGGVNLSDWNAGHSADFNNLCTTMRHVHDGMQYFRAVEAQDGKHLPAGVQGRGALHDHLLIWSPSPMRLTQIRGWAMKAGFGHSVNLQTLVPGSRSAARYVSKYVGKSTDIRELVPWHRARRTKPSSAAMDAMREVGAPAQASTDPETQGVIDLLGSAVAHDPTRLYDSEGGYWVEIFDASGEDWRAWTQIEHSKRATYRTWSKSRDWGLSMCDIKAQAAIYAAACAVREALAFPDPPEFVKVLVPEPERAVWGSLLAGLVAFGVPGVTVPLYEPHDGYGPPPF
jgi:hypothetical protein